MSAFVPSRRGFFGAGLGAAAGLLLAPRAESADYASAAEALDAMEQRATEVAARLQALSALPVARGFCARLLAENEVQRVERAQLRVRLGLGLPAASTALQADSSLAGLLAAEQELVFAQAEGLPAMPDGPAVDRIARHLLTSARHLTLVDLWIESEDARG